MQSGSRNKISVQHIVTYVRFPWLNNVSTATTMDGRFLSYATILGG
jgi:hypothetical protein